MLGQRKPHAPPLTLTNAMNDVVAGTMPRDHPKIMHHHEGFDFVSGNRSLSAVEVSLVNVMSRETVLRQYVNSVKRDYVLLDCCRSLGMLVINALSASDYVLVPVQADYLAAEDMTELVGTVRSIQRQINPRLRSATISTTQVRMDESMMELADSVKQHGILVPSPVRPMPDSSYQMASGHWRKQAAELVELPTAPYIIWELTDVEATIIMVDSNLQREQVLPSEKAFAYKMKLDAMNRQADRPSKK